MDTITLKQKINSVLKTLGVEYFYGQSTNSKFPYIRFTLGDNNTTRLSNKKSTRNIWYQIDVFSMVPLDVQDEDTILYQIESKLESEKLITTDWIETEDTDNNTRYTVYHYFIEVRE